MTTRARTEPVAGRFAGTLVVPILLASAIIGAGCSNAKQGAVTGAGVGALSGLAIGSLSGSAGKGAAIGAVAGAVGGAIIGDQNRRREESSRAQASGTTPIAYHAAPTLDGLLGAWNVTGTVTGVDGSKHAVNGTATGTADKNFFVRLDIRLAHAGTSLPVEGTSVIGQEGGRNLSMVNSFSTSPEMRRFEGEMDESGSVLTFRQVQPPGADRRVVLRRSGGGGWTAEAWNPGDSAPSETLAFSRSR